MMKILRPIRFVLGMLLVFANFGTTAQTPLAGIKICLDPGHGGHDADDRQTELGIGTYYYESDDNWETVGFLDSLLTKLGASVKNTKTTNDPDSPDRQPSLSDRVQVANSFGADYFHSYHTNGSDNKSVNTTIVIYAGAENGVPDEPETLIMADIMDDQLFVYMRTTGHSARADIPLTGYTNGLGVLNNLNMTGVLSESSFHSNIDEGRRLMNSSYRKAAAWAIVKSILEFYEKPELEDGELGGIITDKDGNALNGIEVKLNPGTENEKIYVGDQFLNGFFFFDRLHPGDYEVEFGKFGFDSQVKTITITAGKYTEIDASLTEKGGAPSVPQFTSLSNPGSSSGIRATWIANSETTLLGYRLYYATNDEMDNWVLAADENLLTATHTAIEISSAEDFIVVSDVDIFHFKLTAIAESGAESAAGNIFSRSSNTSGDRILIVDGFDRRNGSFENKFHDFSTSYFKAIRDSKLAIVASATNDAIENASIVLIDYDFVIWYVGDESTEHESFSDAEQVLIQAYMKLGGKLMVSGSEIAWDLDNKGTDSDKAFYHNYLKAEYLADGAVEYSPATGVAESGFEGLQIEFGIIYPEDFPDDIAPVNGATSILDYAVAGKTGGIGYKGVFGEGSVAGGIVNISFPLESAEFTDQKIMIKRVLEYLEVGGYFPIPPAQPVLRLVEAQGTGVRAEWSESSETGLIGYRLYYAIDDDLSDWKLVADETILGRSATEISLSTYDQFLDQPTSIVSHYRLTAISEGGFESKSSDTYSCIKRSSSISALIVDGFDRNGGSGSYNLSQHHFASSYFLALQRSHEMNITTIANEKVIETDFELSNYSMVYWFLGDESSGETTFSSAEQELIQQYLEAGGRLFVSGAEIGWDLVDKGSDEDKLFYKGYLKASYIGDGGVGRSPAKGVLGSDFEGLEIQFGIVYPEDFPDDISPVGGAESIIEYAIDGKFGGVAYDGNFGESNRPGAVIYLSFPLESALAEEMDMMIDKTVSYFGVFDASAPVSQDDFAETVNGSVLIDVLSNDWDLNNDIDSLSIEIVDVPAQGSVSITADKIQYSASANFSGLDSFTYQISDLSGLVSGAATVSVSGSSVLSSDQLISNNASIKLYPNPVATELTILSSNNLMGYEIRDYQGRLIIADRRASSVTDDTWKIDLSVLKKGFYLIYIDDSKFNSVFKLIKE